VADGKSRRFAFFWTDFCQKVPKSDLYGFMEKQAPQKALCLGPDPPPGDFHKIYRNYGIFWVFGPSIQPEKTSPKSASTPYPPSGGAKKWKNVKF
jgi:hypothetical protein